MHNKAEWGKEMKKVILLVLLLSMVLPAAVFGASQEISVSIDGVKLQFSSKPIQENGTTLVPLRTIFEGLGASVKWDAKTQTVKASKNGVNIAITMGQKFAIKDGNKIQLTTKPRTILGVTYVPLRFIGESFGSTIEVHGKEINIVSPVPPSFEYGAKDNSAQTTTPPAQAPNPSTVPSTSTTSVQEIGKLSNRVVYIETYDASNKVLASGSGVVISSDGKIITNYHVIDEAASVKVEFNDQRSFTTSIILSKDESRDLALLKIPATNLAAVTMGDSTTLQLGEEVVAIGSPLGFKNSLTSGVISQTSRNVQGQNYIQISTPIDHGSSGGALFNMKGELVGITSALIESSASINLAIPSSDVKAFLAKPQVEQKLSPSVQQKPSTGSTGKAMDSKALEDYLNKNYGSLSFKGVDLDFDWDVMTSSDGKRFLIGGTMSDGMQWADWADKQEENGMAFPSLILYMSDELKDKLHLTDTFFSLYLNVHLSKYPSSFPAESISREGSGYRLDYNFIYGSVDYKSGYLFYNLDPTDEDSIQSVEID